MTISDALCIIVDIICAPIVLLIFIILSPVILFCFLLLIIWRSIVVILAKCLLTDQVGSISGLDMIFTPDDFLRCPNAALPGVAILEGKPDFNHILEHWTHILNKKRHDGKTHVYERLLQYPCTWLGYCFWKHDNSFDVKNHVKLVEDISLDEDNLTDYLSSIARRPFAPKKPLWDNVIIPNYNANEERFIIIARFHHSIADGLSVMKLVLFGSMGLLTLPVDYAGVKKPNCCAMTYTYFKMFLLAPYVCLKKIILMRDENKLKCRQHSGTWYFTILPKLNLQEIKRTKDDLKSTFTGVMLSAISMGIEKYLETTFGNNCIPSRIHALTSTHFPDHPHDRLTNNWTVLVYAMKLRCTSFKKRLKLIDQMYRKATRSFFPLACYVGFIALGLLPKGLVEVVSKFKSSTVVMTNLPGPTIPCTLFEYPVLEMIVWIPLIREINPLGIAILSYNGNVQISLCGEKAAFGSKDNVNKVGMLIHEEIKSIIHANSVTNQDENVQEV